MGVLHSERSCGFSLLKVASIGFPVRNDRFQTLVRSERYGILRQTVRNLTDVTNRRGKSSANTVYVLSINLASHEFCYVLQQTKSDTIKHVHFDTNFYNIYATGGMLNWIGSPLPSLHTSRAVIVTDPFATATNCTSNLAFHRPFVFSACFDTNVTEP